MSITSAIGKKVSSLFKKPAVVAPKPLVIPKTTPAPMSKAPVSSPAAPAVSSTLKSALTKPISKPVAYGSASLAALTGGAYGMGSNKPPATPTFTKPVVPQVISQGPSSALRDMSIANSPAPSPSVPRVTADSGKGMMPTTPVVPGAPAVNTPAAPASTPNNKKQDKSQRPPVPTVTPEEKAVATAENLYQKSLEVSDDELATQGDLDRLSEATKKAYTGTKNQAIPMGFITGQLASIEERALNLAEPLETRLARMQAARTNAIEASKFALDRADAKYKTAKDSAAEAAKAAAEANKPISIGGALVQKDPVTGEYKTVYQEAAEDKLLSPSEAAALGVPYGTTQSQAYGKSPVAKTDDLTAYQKFQATQAISKETQARTENAREVARQVGLMNQAYSALENDGNLNFATQAIVTTYNKILDPTSVVRETEYDRTAAGQSLLERINGKFTQISQGGGGITKENLQEAVQLANQYLQSSQQSMLRQNQRAQQMAEQFGLNPDFVTSDGFQSAPSLEQYYQTNPQQQPKIDQIIRENPDLSDEDILQIIGVSFNGVGGDTNTASRIANAIKKVESGGDYNARGASGESGAYQFMPATWKQWAGEFLGDSNAPQTPQNQDRVALARIEGWLAEGRTPEQIALLWNSGSTTPRKGVNSYGVPYDSGAYAKKVLGQLA
jgi:hypothetical protein